jgi:hypothetical protein
MEKDEYQYQDPPRWSGFSGDDHKGLSTVLHRNGLEGAVTNENELNQGFSGEYACS